VVTTIEPPVGPAAPEGIVDERHRAGLAPYLGPDPLPSLTLGRVFQALTLVGSAVWLVRAMLLAQQPVELPTFDPLAPPPPVTTVDLLLDLTGVGAFALAITIIIVDFVWRRERRPKELLKAHGEAYVELPVIWIFPMRYRFVFVFAICFAVFARSKGIVSDPTPFTPLATFEEAHRWSLAGALGWAVVWALGVVVPLLSERAHERRLEWSAWYRERPHSVAFAPPVRDNDIGDPEGFGWILRTAGLILAALVGLVTGLAAGSEVAKGNPGGLPWLVGAVVVVFLVVKAFVRRHSTRLPNHF
jgi:hypothetical protein